MNVEIWIHYKELADSGKNKLNSATHNNKDIVVINRTDLLFEVYRKIVILMIISYDALDVINILKEFHDQFEIETKGEKNFFKLNIHRIQFPS